ncbi:hypothetical protein PACTADRAFT_51830 [Pachysolen tannophilus NRRL Y-2460]|uniref:RING-type E3 ubiquitin transferase n=1 Tax=Pachysolen tannophilus NRRL Y-2460 TaxID=669874 RepID=A0A1E4TN82_PACTA|nr:hypothetical protein PACTADRAFT_51830 [Pachysolen tannophilus NRRL Y-2460]
MSSAGDEPVCRICRCESSEDDPLYYPCKCRGSVKYVHQNCLITWLETSKRPEKCDICKTPYIFELILPDNIPDKLPTSVIIRENLKKVIKGPISKTLSIVTGIIFILLQIPLYFVLCIRFFNFVIDDQLLKKSLTQTLLAGDCDTLPYDFEINLPNLWECFKFSFSIGLNSTLILLVSLIGIFVFHEWVSRDSGFEKLMNKNIGSEKINRMLDKTIRDVLLNNPNLNEEQRRQLMNLYDLSVLIQGRDIAMVDASDEQLEREYQRLRDTAAQVIAGVQQIQEAERAEREEDNEEEVEVDDDDDDSDEQEEEEEEEDEDAVADNGHHLYVDEDEEEAEVVEEDPVALAVAPLPAPQVQQLPPLINDEILEDDEDDDVQGLLFGFQVDIPPSMSIKIAICADAAISIILFLIYFLPSLIGILELSGIYHICRTFLILAGASISSNIPLSTKIQQYLDVVFNYAIKPIDKLAQDIITRGLPSSNIKRAIPLILNVFIFLAGVKFAMYKLETSYRMMLIPLRSIKRNIYFVLFDIYAILKVYTIFSIELIYFPAICGFLIDLVSSPIFLPAENYNFKDSKFLTSSLFFTFLRNDYFLRFIIYWITGTLYMSWFALYVGLLRTYVIRRGVLFFIRSPDDPNSRLVHDALVRPFLLQLSRIALSGFVYAVFITVYIGVVTFGTRLLTEKLFPMKIKLISTFFFTAAYTIFYKLKKPFVPLVTKYVRIYWYFAFNYCCETLRLSSFMVGKDNINERGYIHYRSLYHRFFKREKPNYDRPVSAKSVSSYLRDNPQVNAVFIPNGDFIRAPDNDNVSRLYLKKLFVVVTSDDKLLKTKENQNKNKNRKERVDNLLGDEDEVDNVTTHTVVYRPPNFGYRNILLLCMLWIFAIILICGFLITANIIGTPISFFLSLGSKILPNWSLNLILLGSFSEHKVENWFLTLNLSSIFFGALIELYTLLKFDSTYHVSTVQEIKRGAPLIDGNYRQERNGLRQEENRNAEENDDDDDENEGEQEEHINGVDDNDNDNAGRVDIEAEVEDNRHIQRNLEKLSKKLFNTLCFSLGILIWLSWIYFVHKYCITAAFKLYILHQGPTVPSLQGEPHLGFINEIKAFKTINIDSFTEIVKETIALTREFLTLPESATSTEIRYFWALHLFFSSITIVPLLLNCYKYYNMDSEHYSKVLRPSLERVVVVQILGTIVTILENLIKNENSGGIADLISNSITGKSNPIFYVNSHLSLFLFHSIYAISNWYDEFIKFSNDEIKLEYYAIGRRVINYGED